MTEMMITVKFGYHDVYVKIKDTIMMKRVMEACCERNGLNASKYVLIKNNDDTVIEYLTAQTNGIQNGDVLKIVKSAGV